MLGYGKELERNSKDRAHVNRYGGTTLVGAKVR